MSKIDAWCCVIGVTIAGVGAVAAFGGPGVLMAIGGALIFFSTVSPPGSEP